MDIRKRFERRGRSYAQMISDYQGKKPTDNICAGCGKPVPEEHCVLLFQYDGDYYHPECLVPTLKRDLVESDALIMDDALIDTAGAALARWELLRDLRRLVIGEVKRGPDQSYTDGLRSLITEIRHQLDLWWSLEADQTESL